MNKERWIRAAGYVDDEIFTRYENVDAAFSHKQKNRKRGLRLGALAACFCFLLLGSAVLLPMLKADVPSDGIYWTDDREYLERNVIGEEGGYLWPWDCRAIFDQYGSVLYNGSSYRVRGGYRAGAIPTERIGDKLADGEAHGYDIYTETTYTIACGIYRIEGVDPDRFVAVRYEGDDAFYSCMRDAFYEYQTFGEMVEALSLTENLSLTVFSSDSVRYALTEADGDVLWQILLHASAAQASETEDFLYHWDDRIFFSVNSEALGAYNLSFSVSPDGYLWTNVEAYGRCFYIGKETAEAVLAYAEAHKTELPSSDSQVLVGTVTEIGEDYIKVDDSVMMKDPDDGIVFTVYADDLRISRYIRSGFLTVGQTVMIVHSGIYAEEPTAVRTATELYEAEINGTTGDVVIPE